jgi:DNA-binding NarL/FixJ family response regulator
MIHVLVIASSPIARAGLEAVLREDLRFAVLANSGSGISSRGTRPDVVLVEIASVERLQAHLTSFHGDNPPIVLLADHLSRREFRRALHAGARAVLPRDATGAEIVAAIEGVAAGLLVLSSEDIDLLLPPDPELTSDSHIPGEALTSRELEVLSMLAEGLANKEIAARTRGEAVARGIREGLVVI